MFCKNCGNNLFDTDKFCTHCGISINSNHRPKPIEHSSNIGEEPCQVCGVMAPVKYVEFYQNIGLLVMRFNKHIKGKLCKNCINKYFSNFTLVDLFLGWWGVISFFVTIAYLLNNIYQFLRTLSLRYPNTQR
jgi:hypothetical protein